MSTGRPRPVVAAIALSVIVGLVVAGIAWALGAESYDKVAIARVELDDLQVRWPYHDAVIESSVARVNSDAAIEVAQNAAEDIGTITEVSSTMPINQTIFDVRVEASETTAATLAASAVAEWLVADNLAERTAALEAEIEQLDESHTTESERESDAQTRFDNAADEAERVAAAADLRNASGRRAELENEIAARTDQLATTMAQLIVVSTGSADEPSSARAATSLAAGIGVGLLLFALLSALRARRNTNAAAHTLHDDPPGDDLPDDDIPGDETLDVDTASDQDTDEFAPPDEIEEQWSEE